MDFDVLNFFKHKSYILFSPFGFDLYVLLKIVLLQLKAKKK